MQTHTVFNQAPPLVDFNTADYPPLREALARVGAPLDELDQVGAAAGSAAVIELGDRVEAHPPILKTHDRFGNRIDEVHYDPAYHELLTKAFEFGLHGAPWVSNDPNAHLLRAAKFSAWQVVDAGHGCPISMTYSAVPALQVDAELADRYVPLLASSIYDPQLRIISDKQGISAGMSMTEKQGGSDVRANTTTATELADGTYRIVGHKWFTSAPMSDILLTLAQAPGGLTCFVLPRVLPDGSRNAIGVQRLKDKLGNKSNASSEVEYQNAIGWRLGDEGKGVRTIIEMVNGTRLDCTLGTATLMKHGVSLAAHHVNHRAAFGQTLIDQPLMRNVIADLAIEAEASMTVALWLAGLTDQARAGDERAAALRRIGLAVSKYYVCKRGPAHAAEALECLGGNGFVEESRMPRLFRESPLGSIWEGSGNVAALDTLRAIGRQPETLGILFEELEQARGADRRYDEFLTALQNQFTDLNNLEYRARTIVGDLAVAIQASLLLRFGNPAVADGFTGSRLAGSWGNVFGTLDSSIDTAAIIARATPKS
ncbi:acyl-CoA dehydrogenase family protein [Gordonia defluvii]|uniref:Acyl-CoA dehydrogenase family protein n=1 Tax=Gordonia defluvii TaxID=283718 RepID=A0ABP6L7Y5_9ACTN|nr:acyl-CoA dehydrogenase family protein [Gordonia sp. UBA5067]